MNYLINAMWRGKNNISGMREKMVTHCVYQYINTLQKVSRPPPPPLDKL